MLTIFYDYHVSQFTSAKSFAFINLTVNDDSTADSCSKCEHDHILALFSGSCNCFSKCCTICIIRNFNRNRKIVSNFFRKLYIFPFDIIGIANYSVFCIYSSRNSDSCSNTLIHRNSLCFQKFQCLLCNLMDHFFCRTLCIGIHCLRYDQLLVNIHQSNLCLSTSDINSDSDRSCFFADCRNKCITLSFYCITATSGCQEETVSFFERKCLSVILDRSFSIKEQNACKGSI